MAHYMQIEMSPSSYWQFAGEYTSLVLCTISFPLHSHFTDIATSVIALPFWPQKALLLFFAITLANLN